MSGLPFVLALIVAVLGLGGLMADSAEHIHVPFYLFMGLLVLLVVARLIGNRAPPS